MKSSLAKKGADEAANTEGTPVPQGITVTQYWVCSPVDIFQNGPHVYEIEGSKYEVAAYPGDLNFAKAVRKSYEGRKIAEIEVHNYRPQDKIARKNNWTFIGWIK